MENIGTKLLNECVLNDIKICAGVNLHLAIVAQPFYSYMLSGKKTIESRFSINKCSPYLKVKDKDIMFIKDRILHKIFKIVMYRCLTNLLLV